MLDFKLVLLVGLMLLAGCGRQRETDSASQPSGTERLDSKTSSADEMAAASDASQDDQESPKMALLESGQVAVSVNGQSLTWAEVRAAVKLPDGISSQQPATVQERQVRQFLQRLVRRSLFLAEANRRNIQVSDEERQHYLDVLAESLKAGQSKRTVEGFLQQFPATSTSLLDMSYDDMLRVVKLNDALVQSIQISDEEVNTERQRLVARRNVTLQANAAMKGRLEQIATSEDANTDEGFARLAQEHSEGREAGSGGVLGAFKRSAIAQANQLSAWTLEPGQTSQVLETETAYRLIRVLAVEPSPAAEGEELLRIAQILLSKYPVQELPAPDLLREGLKRQRQEEVLKRFLHEELLPTANLDCPLFPDGLY